MSTTHTMKRIIVGALLSGGVAVAGRGLGAGIAQADTAHHWCPGNPKSMPYAPNNFVDWDWTVCHTWYGTNYGQGNVSYVWGSPASVWDGDNPPLDAITPRQCPPIAFMCP